MAEALYKVGVDIGGTFTDSVVVDADGTRTIAKALTTYGELDQGVLDSLAANARQRDLSVEQLLSRTAVFVHGTTQATNALLTRHGAKTGLITTKGHEDSILIGKIQSKVAGLPERELIHSSRLEKPEPIVPRPLIHGITERVDRDGEIVVTLDEDEVRVAVEALVSEGVEAVAVSLLWSFLNPTHEHRVAEIVAATAPELHVALSHEIAPVLGEYERTATTAISAYIGPRVAGYLGQLEERLTSLGLTSQMLVMQASGGLTSAADGVNRPIVTLDSGPTGGVLGCQYLGELLEEENVICTDVGGTSFDVGMILGGKIPLDPEPVVGKYTLRMPKVLVESIGAGGGSVAWVDEGGLLRVGPRSAGSQPGPACYGSGGTEPTVTDADLVLGYLDPVGAVGGSISLRRDLALAALATVGERLGIEPEDVAIGIERIVNAQMADLVRRSTIEQGDDPRDCILVAYGGAGPTHAAFYGADIGVKDIVIPPESTVFSAEGMLTCDLVHIAEMSHRAQAPLDPAMIEGLGARLEKLDRQVREHFDRDGGHGEVGVTYVVGVRFLAQVHTLAIEIDRAALSNGFDAHLGERFRDRYEQVFGAGAVIDDAALEIEFLRVTGRRSIDPIPFEPAAETDDEVGPVGERDAYFEGHGFVQTKVFEDAALHPGALIEGPAIIQRMGDSVTVPPAYRARVDRYNFVRLELS
ncbi:MAG: hydantoinase/oxoprolinase family protein [Solirubrobacterales bacterium]